MEFWDGWFTPLEGTRDHRFRVGRSCPWVLELGSINLYMLSWRNQFPASRNYCLSLGNARTCHSLYDYGALLHEQQSDGEVLCHSKMMATYWNTHSNHSSKSVLPEQTLANWQPRLVFFWNLDNLASGWDQPGKRWVKGTKVLPPYETDLELMEEENCASLMAGIGYDLAWMIVATQYQTEISHENLYQRKEKSCEFKILLENSDVSNHGHKLLADSQHKGSIPYRCSGFAISTFIGSKAVPTGFTRSQSAWFSKDGRQVLQHPDMISADHTLDTLIWIWQDLERGAFTMAITLAAWKARTDHFAYAFMVSQKKEPIATPTSLRQKAGATARHSRNLFNNLQAKEVKGKLMTIVGCRIDGRLIHGR